jgi:hypothetical protein
MISKHLEVREIQGWENLENRTSEIRETLGSQDIYIYKLKNTKKKREIIKSFNQIKSFVMEGGDSWTMEIEYNEGYKKISSKNNSSITLLKTAFLLYTSEYYLAWSLYNIANEIEIKKEIKKKKIINTKIKIKIKIKK